jgi:CBS domain-containing protein
VVDGEGKLKGWLDLSGLSGATTVREEMGQVNIEAIALGKGATLREALSRMLGQGFGSVPVVDEEGQLLGELRLHDVEAATAEAES